MMRRQVQQRVWTGIILVLTLVPGLLSAGAGEAATYYVATSGSSGCSTNINAPSDNVQNSLNCLSPGDTLYFRRGTYNIGTGLNNPPSGTSSARITIAGYPQDGPLAVRLNVGSSGSNGLTISGPRYLTFDNLVIDASAAEAAGFKVTGSAGYIRLQNSEVRNAGTQGILTTDSTGGNEFLNVKVHDNGRNTQFDHGLYISSSDNVVEGCEIYNNANFGVHVYGEGTSIDRNIVRKNRIYGNGSAMVIGAGDNNMAYNNLVYSNGTGIQIRNGGTGKVALP